MGFFRLLVSSCCNLACFMYALPSSTHSMIAAASICPGWCFSRWVRWSANSGFPCITSQKRADKTSANTTRMLASKQTVEAKAEPTAVPFTIASPSFGNNVTGFLMPAIFKPSTADTVVPASVTALELGLAVSSPVEKSFLVRKILTIYDL